MAKPKLLVLASTFPKAKGDGTPGFVLDLAIEQAKEFDVSVLTPLVPGSTGAEVIEGVKVIRYRYWPFAQELADGSILDNLRQRPSLWSEVPFLFLGLSFELARQLKKLKPDVIHAHWIIPQGLVAAIGKGGTPLLITAHGGDIYALNGGSLRNLKIWALQRAAANSTVNREMSEQLCSWGIEKSKTHVLPMGTDFSRFAAGAKNKIPGSVLAVGRLVEKKGIDVLIDAIRHGLEKKKLPTDISVKIAGDGPLRKQLEEQARGLPIEFLGNQSGEQIANLLAQSEVFVIPSRVAKSGDREGLPVTLMEAAASGSFVIASKLPGIDELILDGESGVLVEPESFKALSTAIGQGLRDEDFRRRCGDLLRDSATRFDIQNVGAEYNSLLRSLK